MAKARSIKSAQPKPVPPLPSTPPAPPAAVKPMIALAAAAPTGTLKSSILRVGLEEHMPHKELDDEVKLLPQLVRLRGLRELAVRLAKPRRDAQLRDPFSALAALTVQLVMCIRAEFSISFVDRRELQQRSTALVKALPDKPPPLNRLPPADLWILPVRHRFLWQRELAGVLADISREAKKLAAVAGHASEGQKVVDEVSDCIVDLFTWSTSKLYSAAGRKTGDAWKKLNAFELDKVGPAVERLTLFEMQVESAQARKKTPNRLEFDDETLTVKLDGVVVGPQLQPCPYQLIKTLGIPGKLGTWVTGKEIEDRPGMKGKKLVREMRKLPDMLKKMISSSSGAGKGYCLTLPPLKTAAR